jgi:hypothetical protein
MLVTDLSSFASLSRIPWSALSSLESASSITKRASRAIRSPKYARRTSMRVTWRTFSMSHSVTRTLARAALRAAVIFPNV